MKKAKRTVLLFALIVCVLFSTCACRSGEPKASPIEADVAYFRDYLSLAAGSDIIAFGKVTAFEYKEHAAPFGALTLYSFEPEEILKGSWPAGKEFKITQLGGVWNDTRFVLNGSCEFETGCEYFVFLGGAYDDPDTGTEETDLMRLTSPFQNFVKVKDGVCDFTANPNFDDMTDRPEDGITKEAFSDILKNAASEAERIKQREGAGLSKTSLDIDVKWNAAEREMEITNNTDKELVFQGMAELQIYEPSAGRWITCDPSECGVKLPGNMAPGEKQVIPDAVTGNIPEGTYRIAYGFWAVEPGGQGDVLNPENEQFLLVESDQ